MPARNKAARFITQRPLRVGRDERTCVLRLNKSACGESVERVHCLQVLRGRPTVFPWNAEYAEHFSESQPVPSFFLTDLSNNSIRGVIPELERIKISAFLVNRSHLSAGQLFLHLGSGHRPTAKPG